jgi:hypothetical protein
MEKAFLLMLLLAVEASDVKLASDQGNRNHFEQKSNESLCSTF